MTHCLPFTTALTTPGTEIVPVVSAVELDGSSYLGLGGILTGATDTKEYTASVWFYPTVSAVSGLIVGDRFQLYIGGGNKIVVSLGSGDGSTAALLVSNTAVTLNQWNSVQVSVDCANGTNTLYLNDTLDTLDTDINNDKTIDFTKADTFIGARSAATQTLTGSIAEAWMDNTYFDMSVLANRRKFITAGGEPGNLGVTGAVPTGSAPLICLNGAAASWATNKGTGGGFTLTGTAPESTDLPVEL